MSHPILEPTLFDKWNRNQLLRTKFSLAGDVCRSVATPLKAVNQEGLRALNFSLAGFERKDRHLRYGLAAHEALVTEEQISAWEFRFINSLLPTGIRAEMFTT